MEDFETDWIEKNRRILGLTFFLVFFFVGLLIYQDYGVSWDEPRQRETGLTSFNYVFNSNTSLINYTDKDYGVAFELPLIILEKMLKLEDSRDIFLMRHLVTFLVFFFGVIFFYLLCKKIFKNWKIGYLGSLFLILSPRIFADSFYNTKDLVFLSIFIISIHTMIIFLDHKTPLNSFLHAFVCSILIDIRIIGIVVPFLTFILSIYDFFKKTENKNKKKLFSLLILYFFILTVFIIVFWPWLWSNPLNFFQAFDNMSKFRWEGTVLYSGKIVESTNLPWHYTPVWISITTPPLYLLLFLVGLLVYIRNKIDRNNLIILLWFFFPLFYVTVFKSVLYDAWRHMFFVYPAFLIVSLLGLIFIFKFMKSKLTKKAYRIFSLILIIFIILNILSITRFMVINHPYQNLYFNFLAGNRSEIKDKFEMDYWGLSYKEALEYVIKNDSSEKIKLTVEDRPGIFNSYILGAQDRNRLEYKGRLNESDFLLTNYRRHEKDYPYKEVYAVVVDDVKILGVYKLKSSK